MLVSISHHFTSEHSNKRLEETSWSTGLNRNWKWLLVLGILVNAAGILSPILEPDGALYATIAKNMVLSGDYFNLTLHGYDWLDKPHFQFWITALSFKLLGISTLGYKLPAFLFWLLGLLYTFRFAKLFYPTEVARLATLIYVSAFHLVLSNNDVRAEPYLTGLLIASLYHCYVGITEKRMTDILAGAFFTAAAIMTKGIFIGLLIFPGLLLHQLLTGSWNRSFLMYSFLTLLLIFLFIIPELLCLYFQFDAHPEKIVFGRTHVSGVRFFFWDSQFGRFFNTGPIRGEGDPTFFLHTTLWAFFPWAFIFFSAVYSGLRNFIWSQQEKVSLVTIIFTFLLFSFSKFQLPHYLNIIFPLMSIQSANFLFSLNARFQKTWAGIFLFLGAFSLGLTIFLAYYSVPQVTWIVTILAIGIIAAFVFSKTRMPMHLGFTFIASIAFYFFLNSAVTPVLLRYQAGLAASDYLKREFPISPAVTMLNEDQSYTFDFYSPAEVKYVGLESLNNLTTKPLLFCNENFIPTLIEKKLQFDTLASFPHYHVSQPSSQLLNARSRDISSKRYFLLKFK